MSLLGTFIDLPAYMLVASGFYISYRVLNFPDLTVDASWVVGTVAAAVGAIQWFSSLWGMMLAIGLSGLAGVITALIYLANPKPAYKLLAGVLVVLAYFSLDYHLLSHKLYVGFAQQPTAMKWLLDYQARHRGHTAQPLTILAGMALVAAQWLLFYWLLQTKYGLKLRTIGTRPHIVATSARDLAPVLISGLVLSNVTVGIGGWYYAVCNSWADITIFGTIISALTSVILGETFLEAVPKLRDRRISIPVLLSTPLVGAFFYHFLRVFVNWAMINLSRDESTQTISVIQQDQTAILAGILIGFVLLAKALRIGFRVPLASGQATAALDEEAV
jgi:putative tryptophan/tyrosine transport system permease protein